MESFFGKFGRVTRTYQDVFGHQMSTRVRERACTAHTAFSHGGAGRNGCARACIGHVQDLFLHALAEVGVESVARLESAVNDDVLRYRARLLSIQTMLERHLERLTGVPVHACFLRTLVSARHLGSSGVRGGERGGAGPAGALWPGSGTGRCPRHTTSSCGSSAGAARARRGGCGGL